MAQAGIIKAITGDVSAQTPDGQIRQLAVGDVIYENDIIKTDSGSEITIELDDGRILNLAEDRDIVIDESVVAAVDPQDAVVAEVQALQAALEEGEEIPNEETAAGEEDPGHDYNLAYDAGDQSGGDVGSYLFGTAYGDEDEDFPDIDGVVEELPEEPEEPEEPEPVFILGSDPQDHDYDYNEEQEIDRPFWDDVNDTSETDYHTINPAGDNIQGAIVGQDGADILVGDSGSVSLEHLSNNYILILDYSLSVSDINSLKNAIESAIQTLYTRVQNSVDGYEVKINLLPFAGEADYDNNSAWISYTNQNGTVVIDGGINSTTGTEVIDTIKEIIDWVDASIVTPGTNYSLALTEAQHFVDNNYDQNSVIFISDGSYNMGGNYDIPLSTLDYMVDQNIHAVGISVSSNLFLKELIHIDSDGQPSSIKSVELSDVMVDLMPQDFNLDPTGSDEIYGNDGDDIIFGDVLNTDGILDDLSDPGSEYYNADYDLSTIENLPDGSGWEVFANLEEANPDLWTREDTLQYIQDNHEDLAKEAVLGTGTEEGDVRDGGHDYIEGGAGNDTIYGQEGNDEIYGQDGDDVIDAGSGDDVVDGGSGFDTLVVTSETELDFSNVSNIESIDLNEDGVDQTITLSLDQVLSMTDEDNTLQITGEMGDSVILTGVGTADGEWTQDTGNPGLFTQNGTANQVTIADFDGDGVDIQIDVDNGTSFDV